MSAHRLTGEVDDTNAGTASTPPAHVPAIPEQDAQSTDASTDDPAYATPTPWTPLFTAGPIWARATTWGTVLVGTPLVVLATLSAGAPLPLVAALAWFPLLYVIDMVVLRLPTPLVWGAGLSALVVSAAQLAGGDLSLGRLLGAAGCAAATFFVFAAAYVFLPPGSFGLGDLRLAVVISYAVALQGYLDVVMALWVIAPLSAVVYALGLGWFRSALPYGPALITGAVTVAAWPGLFVPSLT